MGKEDWRVEREKELDVKRGEVWGFGFYVIMWFNIVRDDCLELWKERWEVVVEVRNEVVDEVVNVVVVECRVLMVKDKG